MFAELAGCPRQALSPSSSTACRCHWDWGLAHPQGMYSIMPFSCSAQRGDAVLPGLMSSGYIKMLQRCLELGLGEGNYGWVLRI